MSLSARLLQAARVAGLHLLFSLVVAGLAAYLVFGVWFPYPYRELVGGRELFILVVGVDVVCGPLLTLVLFNAQKSRRELSLDLSIVALIQLMALVYGLHTVALARPVYLAFEVDRFRAVTASDVKVDALKPELGGLQVLGWRGPKVIGVRKPRDGDEMLQSLELSLSGYDPSVRPDWWVAYETVQEAVLKRAKPVEMLRSKRPQDKSLIDVAVKESETSESKLAWIPVTSFQSTGWVAFVDNGTAEIKAFAPMDAF